jgi:hypothetical protein
MAKSGHFNAVLDYADSPATFSEIAPTARVPRDMKDSGGLADQSRPRAPMETLVTTWAVLA